MSDDPAVRAAIETGRQHTFAYLDMDTGCKEPVHCSCGECFSTLQAHDEHVMAVRVEAARPIWLAQLADEVAGEADWLAATPTRVAEWLRARAAVRTEPENG